MNSLYFWLAYKTTGKAYPESTHTLSSPGGRPNAQLEGCLWRVSHSWLVPAAVTLPKCLRVVAHVGHRCGCHWWLFLRSRRRCFPSSSCVRVCSRRCSVRTLVERKGLAQPSPGAGWHNAALSALRLVFCLWHFKSLSWFSPGCIWQLHEAFWVMRLKSLFWINAILKYMFFSLDCCHTYFTNICLH